MSLRWPIQAGCAPTHELCAREVLLLHAKAPPKASLNGKEAKLVALDFARMRGCDVRACLQQGKKLPSHILEGYRQAMLACGLDIENLDQIVEVLVHFSFVAEIMDMMRPTAAQRATFRSECRLYRAKKMVVWEGAPGDGKMVGAAQIINIIGECVGGSSLFLAGCMLDVATCVRGP